MGTPGEDTGTLHIEEHLFPDGREMRLHYTRQSKVVPVKMLIESYLSNRETQRRVIRPTHSIIIFALYEAVKDMAPSNSPQDFGLLQE